MIYQIGKTYGDLGVPQSKIKVWCLSLLFIVAALCNISVYFINKTTLQPFVINEKEPIDPELLGVQIGFQTHKGPLNLITSNLTRDDFVK